MRIEHPRDVKDLKKMFIERPMQTDLINFDFIINNPHLYCFYDELNNELLGYVFITERNKRLFLNGVSKSRQMPNVVTAIIAICEAYNKPMYSDTDLKPAILVLRRAGFKRLRNTNIYKRSKKHG